MLEGGLRPRQGVTSLGHGEPERTDLGEQRLLGGEVGVFDLGGDGGSGDLVHLKTEQVERSGQRPGVPAELDEALVDRGELATSYCYRLEVGPREGVESVALRRLVQQRLVRVLSMEVDQAIPDLREHRDWSHPAVHIGTRAPRGGDRPREHDLPVAVHEAPFDHGFGRARAHDGRVGPAAEEQLERLYDERLAGTGLAREGRHARADDEVEIGDDP